MSTASRHQWKIAERQYERHEARRGRRHAYERLDPPRTALVVIDMIPFFCEENPYARGIVPAIASLASTLRDAGGSVAWVVPGTSEPSAMQLEFFGREVAHRYGASGGAGTLTERLWPDFEIAPPDLIVEKFAASAFFPGRCNLHELLNERSIDTVLITGTVANVCCESSIRDAFTLGYRAIAVADAIAAITDQDLNASLHTIYRSFGDVRSQADVEELLHHS